MEGVLRILVLAVFLVVFVESRNKSPLLDDDHAISRNKAAECVFGKQIRELGSQWIPDLGVPIGVLYCMKCECLPIQKKRRIVAKVQCRNIKSECPEPSCDEPVLLPGRCCKSCPGDDHNPDIIDIVPQNAADDDEISNKHFAALLTGRSSLDLHNHSWSDDFNKNNVVATGRFTFHRKNLHFSFYISEKAARPRSLHFIDHQGNILEEFILSHAGGLVNSLYQNATRKVCGIWRRLPKGYRHLLKEEKMYVVLIWGNKDTEFTLSGRVMRYLALGSEQFSSLLEPAPGTDSMMMAGAGGTAIVSTSSSLSPVLHLAIIFNGLFTNIDDVEVPLNVMLVLEEKKQVILQENIIVHQPATDLNLIELSSTVSQADLRSLSRGRLVVTVSSVSKPEALRLSGNVITKITCEIFQTTLSSEKHSQDGDSGLAWMYLNNQGSLIYNVQVDNLDSDTYHLMTLTDPSGKKKAEVYAPFHKGWANGTEEKMAHKIIDPLYNGKLDMSIVIANDTLHGYLSPKLVADARDAPAPVLLKRENYTLPSSVVGIVWISVDNDCHFHYDVSISGLGHDRKLELYMEMYPIIAPGAPYIQKHLEDFQGNQVEGSPVEALSKEELDRLDGGVTFIKVKDIVSQVILLSATLPKMQLPLTCRSPFTDNNVPTLLDNPLTLPTEECFFEGKFYKKDTSWESTKNPCQTCFCEDGTSKCDFMPCPKIDCPQNNITMTSGECCPVCSNQHATKSGSNKCTFNGRIYSAGSKFYPFLIPTGFDTCTECFCNPKSLEIECKRLDDNEKNCCRNCKNINSSASTSNDDGITFIQNKYGSKHKEDNGKPPALIMKEGGCRNQNDERKPYPNGSKFHPFLASLGEYKCVTCTCHNGSPTCVRQRCEWKTCKKLFDFRRERRAKKMPMDLSDYCCTVKECKRMRHRKKVEERTSHTQ
ncbi:chordin short gastrulation [Leptinotarsa decemlineata]|uniref:chordin short gastrulation n=1 Tax=Leptinotarsa decemlineata TaxID=7539 RepID=UPI003D30C988